MSRKGVTIMLSSIVLASCSDYNVDKNNSYSWPWNETTITTSSSFADVLSACTSLATTLDPDVFCADVDSFSDTSNDTSYSDTGDDTSYSGYDNCIAAYTGLHDETPSFSSRFTEKNTTATVYKYNTVTYTYGADDTFYTGMNPEIVLENEDGDFMQCKIVHILTGCNNDVDYYYESTFCYLPADERTNSLLNDRYSCAIATVINADGTFHGNHYVKLHIRSLQCPNTSSGYDVKSDEGRFLLYSSYDEPNVINTDVAILHTRYSQDIDALVSSAKE